MVAIKRITGFDRNEYELTQVLREIQLMKELGGKIEGHRHIPILYDVLMYESINNLSPRRKNIPKK